MRNTLQARVIGNKWGNVNTNRKHMEELILKLMANPATEAEHLAQAHAMYSNMCKELAEISYAVDHVLRTGKPPPEALFPKVHSTTCSCGHTFKFVENAAGVRCPACGMY